MKPLFQLCLFLLLTARLVWGGEDIDDLLLSGIADRRVSQQGLLELIAEASQTQRQKPRDYMANWMLAALNYFYGDFYATSSEEKKAYFTRCKEYAEIAVKLNPQGPAGHYWLGVGLAKWAEYNGILHSLFTADDILNEMNTVIKLKPSFFKGLPFAIRATVYAMAPPVISVGNKEQAQADIQTALIYGKDTRAVYQIVADIYIYWKEWGKAAELIQQGLSLPYDKRLPLEEADCLRKLNEAQKKVEAELAKQKR